MFGDGTETRRQKVIRRVRVGIVVAACLVGTAAAFGYSVVATFAPRLLPPGTLAANLAGGYLIGLAIAVFTHFGSLPVEERLRFFA